MFGISSAPELYQHTIQQVLEGCGGAYNIHDDIIIHGRTVKEHDVGLRKTFERIQEKGLTLNRDKCAFSTSKLPFMAYLLSNQGIGRTQSRVEAVVDQCSTLIFLLTCPLGNYVSSFTCQVYFLVAQKNQQLASLTVSLNLQYLCLLTLCLA